MRKKITLALMALLITAPAMAENYTIDPSHTFPGFEINHLGFSTQRGRFNRTEGKLSLDAAKKTGTVDITIDATSIDTGLQKLEEHLQTEDFFDVKKFPTLTFRSNKVIFKDGKPSSVEGEFTMHGITKPVTLSVSSFNCGVHPMSKKDVCGAEVKAKIKRSEFGISAYVPAVGDEVTLKIQVEMVKD